MPNIDKTKLKKKSKPQKPNLPTKSKSTHDYYCCCAEKTKQGLKGTKITQLTKYCKNQASTVVKAKQQTRDQEKKKILESWKQIGVSLGKIIDNA